jgi:dTDP-L-rhamnose 4-epimerase
VRFASVAWFAEVMRVLVTGAAGFIGSHIAETMQAAGHDVRGLDSLTPAVHNGRPDYVCGELIVGDVRDPSAVDEALAGMDAVCHQAAMVGLGVDLSDLPAYADVNVTGTAVLLEAMGRHGIPRLVFASSMVVYGEGAYDCATHGRVRPAPRHPGDLAAGRFEPRCPRCAQPLATATVSEDAALDPRNAYAASKVGQEHFSASWARLTGGAAVGLRYHNVYGPRMPRDTPYSGVAAIFRSRLENGAPPRVFEDGGQRRDFVHVRDVARANLLALEAVDRAVADAEAGTGGTGTRGTGTRGTGTRGTGTRGTGTRGTEAGTGGAEAGALRCYNVASGEPHTVGEMASTLAAAFGGIEPVVTGDFRLGDVRHIVASPATAARDLGFRAQIRFADGMAEFAHAPLREPAMLTSAAR